MTEVRGDIVLSFPAQPTNLRIARLTAALSQMTTSSVPSWPGAGYLTAPSRLTSMWRYIRCRLSELSPTVTGRSRRYGLGNTVWGAASRNLQPPLDVAERPRIR